MVHLADINSLSDFQRNTRRHLLRLQKSGRPAVLTINGKAALVVQDAESYQKLLDRLEEVDTVRVLRARLASLKRGVKTRPLVTALRELKGDERPARRKRAG